MKQLYDRKENDTPTASMQLALKLSSFLLFFYSFYFCCISHQNYFFKYISKLSQYLNCPKGHQLHLIIAYFIFKTNQIDGKYHCLCLRIYQISPNCCSSHFQFDMANQNCAPALFPYICSYYLQIKKTKNLQFDNFEVSQSLDAQSISLRSLILIIEPFLLRPLLIKQVSIYSVRGFLRQIESWLQLPLVFLSIHQDQLRINASHQLHRQLLKRFLICKWHLLPRCFFYPNEESFPKQFKTDNFFDFSFDWFISICDIKIRHFT